MHPGIKFARSEGVGGVGVIVMGVPLGWRFPLKNVIVAVFDVILSIARNDFVDIKCGGIFLLEVATDALARIGSFLGAPNTTWCCIFYSRLLHYYL